MYSRASRGVVQLSGSTPSHIGPGTYDTANFENKKQNLGPNLTQNFIKI